VALPIPNSAMSFKMFDPVDVAPER